MYESRPAHDTARRPQGEPPDPPRSGTPPPRARRPVAVAVGCLLAVVLVPVAVDRVACARTEDSTARAFQDAMNTTLPPKVRVHGLPVLSQLAAGTLRDVDLTAQDIPADGETRPLPVSELSLHMEGLRKSDDENEATAREAEATAFLSYADVSNALGVKVARGDGPRRITARVPLPFGDEATATATVSALPGNRVGFGGFQVTGGALPTVGEALLDMAFEQPTPLRNIPDGLRLRSVTTTAKGLRAHFSGESVTFRPAGRA
ncbi:LmeA family phospholipid-binding protein [Streptomyces sp. NPDC003635]